MGLSHADDESRDAAKRPYLRVSAHRAGSRRQIKNKKVDCHRRATPYLWLRLYVLSNQLTERNLGCAEFSGFRRVNISFHFAAKDINDNA